MTTQQIERETRYVALQVRATGSDGAIEGYGSVFGVRDTYDDIIAPGAFKASLVAHKAAGTMPAMLWQHDSGKPVGVWTEMTEDASGLRIKGQLALETTLGKEAHALLQLGALNGLSIGFVAKLWTYDRETDVRTLTELDLWEVSLVTFPANTAARITNVKASDLSNLVAPSDAQRLLRNAGFSPSDAAAFVSHVMQMSDTQKQTADAMRAANQLLKSLQQP